MVPARTIGSSRPSSQRTCGSCLRPSSSCSSRLSQATDSARCTRHLREDRASIGGADQRWLAGSAHALINTCINAHAGRHMVDALHVLGSWQANAMDSQFCYEHVDVAACPAMLPAG